MKKTKNRNKKNNPHQSVKPESDRLNDSMAALRTIIQDDMAKHKSKKNVAQSVPKGIKSPLQVPAPQSNPITPSQRPPSSSSASLPSPPVKNEVPMSEAQKASAATPAPQNMMVPDISALTPKIMAIAARSQKMVAAFLERNKTMGGKMKPLDPGHVGQAFADFTGKILAKPDVFVETQIAFWQDYIKLMKGALEAQANGGKLAPVIAPESADKRFKDPAWQEAWVFDFIKQSYLLTARWAQSLLDHVDGIDPKIAHKVAFYTHQMVDALAPTNFWLTNPEVLRTTIETKGENLLNGLSNLLDDIERGHGELMISMSNDKAFKFGENIAATKGKVVYQNDLMQLIQYAPLTDTVHKTPILITPPWINKYYILDLKPESSYIRFMVEQGHTVFCISWVNPDARHKDMSFDDYMMLGPVAACMEIAKITGEKEVNCVGYCIGGTALSCMLGWLAALGDKKPEGMPEVKSATFLVTLIDFEEPGEIGVFIDEDQVQLVESMMEGPGYLPANAMGCTFAMLRANDLIWSFVVNNYLMGREPFPFDLLSWNADSTNLPQAMHKYYLRNMYLNNNLIKPNTLSMKGTPIDLRNVKVPTFCLSTQEDHITPWRSTYVATQTYSGPVTFCLSGSGHIAGVVNPPAKKKYGYWMNPAYTNNAGATSIAKCPANPEEWLKGATKNEGSWWPEWAKWVKGHAGEMVAPRDPAANPNVIEDAPGSYVRVKVL